MRLGLGLGLSGAQSSVSPSALFAAGDPGFWFDPSDFSTLFQDSAGTTPVTAAGQSVGLVLDKSKGLVLGPELVTNGDFSGGTTGWTVSAQSSISGGQARIVSTDGSFQNIAQNKTLNGPAWYEVSLDVVSVASGSLNFAFTGAGVNVSIPAGAGRRVVRFFVASNTSSSLSFGRSAGVTDITIDNVSVRELPGIHATAAGTKRPTYQIDASGRPYLSFDGVDDALVTSTITPGTDKVQVFAGVRKLSDAATAIVAEMGSGAGGQAINKIAVLAPRAGGFPTYGFQSLGSGTTGDAATSNTYAAPITNVLTCIGDIANDVAILRANGTQAATSAADQGTGNYLAYPLYIGARAGTSTFFNGRLYGLIGRFGPSLSAGQIANTEGWLNAKTGAY